LILLNNHERRASMPIDGQNEPASTGYEKHQTGLFKNSLLGWRDRFQAERPEGPAEPVPPKKLKPPRRRGRGGARPR
jgi:hypothetical protein